jgi:hypothetical protein
MNIIKVPFSPFISVNEIFLPSVDCKEKSLAFSPKLHIGVVIAMKIFKKKQRYSQ